jgi:hypothetical protein
MRSIKRHRVFDSSDFVLPMHNIMLFVTYISVFFFFQSGFRVSRFRESLMKATEFRGLLAFIFVAA